MIVLDIKSNNAKKERRHVIGALLIDEHPESVFIHVHVYIDPKFVCLASSDSPTALSPQKRRLPQTFLDTRVLLMLPFRTQLIPHLCVVHLTF